MIMVLYMQYNPQVAIQLTLINSEGAEVEASDEFSNIANKTDYNYHAENKPIHLQADIQESLGSNQDSCIVKIYNHPFIERIRSDPNAVIGSLSDNFYRLRVWAWHDDNGQVTQSGRPNIPPCFVGDVLDGFATSSESITDSSITIQAQSHSWLATAGKMRNTWPAGTTYDVIVDDIFEWFLTSRNYGRETFGASPKKVIESTHTRPLLASKELKRPFTIDRNPMETLNDICRDFDACWGFHCNIPYFLARNRFFKTNEINQTPVSTNTRIYSDSGKIGLTNYGMFSFSASALFSPEMIPGATLSCDDEPQVDSLEVIGGRLDEINISIDNEQGITSDLSFSYVSQAKVRMPRRREDNSGRHYR